MFFQVEVLVGMIIHIVVARKTSRSPTGSLWECKKGKA